MDGSGIAQEGGQSQFLFILPMLCVIAWLLLGFAQVLGVCAFCLISGGVLG